MRYTSDYSTGAETVNLLPLETLCVLQHWMQSAPKDPASCLEQLPFCASVCSVFPSPGLFSLP